MELQPSLMVDNAHTLLSSLLSLMLLLLLLLQSMACPALPPAGIKRRPACLPVLPPCSP